MQKRTGHFLLESGHHGETWLELDALFQQPCDLQPFASQLADRLRAYDIDAVCGPLTGGAFVAYQVSLELGIGFFFSERTSHEPGAMFSAAYELPEGMRATVEGKTVAIVDDVVVAGSAVRATAKTLQHLGAQVSVVGALLGTGTAAFDSEGRVLPFEVIQLSESARWEPDTCPSCTAGILLETP